ACPSAARGTDWRLVARKSRSGVRPSPWASRLCRWQCTHSTHTCGPSVPPSGTAPSSLRIASSFFSSQLPRLLCPAVSVFYALPALSLPPDVSDNPSDVVSHGEAPRVGALHQLLDGAVVVKVVVAAERVYQRFVRPLARGGDCRDQQQ